MLAALSVPGLNDEEAALQVRMRLTQGFLKLFGLLEQQSPTVLLSGSGLLVAGLACLDAATAAELSFGVFYLVPIGIVAWMVSYRWGMVMAGLSVLLYIIGDIATRPHAYGHALIPVWNTAARFSFFACVVWLLASLRTALDREKHLARTDYLTGAANTRSFWEIGTQELARAHRYHHPLSLITFDVDNFKAVNDQLGHPIGDQVLQDVVRTARSCLRSHDLIARLGGDEFAILLPETNHEAAVTVSHKLQTQLGAAVQAKGYPISFSMGVVTCTEADMAIASLMRHADAAMYQVKRTGKNGIAYVQLPA